MARKKKVLEQVEILDAGSEGKSIARVNEQVIFIENVVPGDVVDVLITRKKKSFLEGRAIKFHSESGLRIKPFCSYFGTCGGCKWQNLDYNQQLVYKQKQVKDNLERIGKLELPELLPILASAKQQYYRNKLEFTFSNNSWLTAQEIESKKEYEHRNALGFHIPKRFDKILDIEHCYLQEEPSNKIRNSVREYALKHELAFFDLIKQEGLLRNLTIRTTSTGEVMVILSFYREGKEIKGLLDHLRSEFPEINSLQYVINGKRNDTISDLEVKTHSGKSFITEEMEDPTNQNKKLQFKIGPKSFFQTNSDQANRLYKLAFDFAEFKGDELVYDLYTGTGTIANYIASSVKKVVGLEYIPEAIEDATENSKINEIENTIFYAGDIKDLLNTDFVESNGKPDIIITDPPRAGMHQEVIDQILKVLPDKIIYISCNPATQARDLAIMKEHYKITKVQPVDMFPQTHHVENVIVMKKV